MTACTPGNASASESSIPMIRAWAWGLVSNFAYNMPRISISSTKAGLPLANFRESTLGSDLPTTCNSGASGARTNFGATCRRMSTVVPAVAGPPPAISGPACQPGSPSDSSFSTIRSAEPVRRQLHRRHHIQLDRCWLFAAQHGCGLQNGLYRLDITTFSIQDA